MRALVGVSFSPAGLLTPFHLGVSQQLQSLGIIHDQCALAGASGGALAAVLSAVPPSALTTLTNFSPLDSSLYIAKQCRDYGARGILGKALDTVLEQTIPENAAQLLNERAAPCIIAYTELTLTGLKPNFISHFLDRKDVIDCLRASCNIPFYLFNSFTVPVRNSSAIDGFLATDMSRFGCPVTGASEIEILVAPFKRKVIRLDPWKIHPKDSSLVYEIISPDLLDRKQWPFRSRELIQMAFTAPVSSKNPIQPISDDELIEKYQILFQGGIEATNRWYETSRLNQVTA